MNATDLLNTADVNLMRRDARNLWRAGNEAGEGFAAVNNDVNNAGEGELVLRAYTDGEVAVYVRKNGDVVLVGDANGAWAVRVSA